MWPSVQPRDARVSDAHWWNACFNLRARLPLLAFFLKCENRMSPPAVFIHNLGSGKPAAGQVITRILLKTQLLTKLLLECNQNH